MGGVMKVHEESDKDRGDVVDPGPRFLCQVAGQTGDQAPA